MIRTTANAPGEQSLGRLDFTMLAIGEFLPGPIFSVDGKVLVRRGRKLSLSDLEDLVEYVADGIFGGQEWPGRVFETDDPDIAFSAQEPDNVDDRPRATAAKHGDDKSLFPPSGDHLLRNPVNGLTEGERLSQDVYSPQGVLLLSAGSEVTSQFIARLQDQGIYEVHTVRPDWSSPESGEPSSSELRIAWDLDRELARRTPGEMGFAHRTTDYQRLDLKSLREETQRGREVFTRSVDRVAEITEDVLKGRHTTVSAAMSVIDEFVGMVRVDASLLPAVVKLKESPSEYLYQHGMNVALLSIATAAELCVPREHLLDIGIGALLQDVGMMRVPKEIRFAPRSLTEEELAEVARHPVYTLNFLENMSRLSKTSMVIAYQSHERGDCSGYPNKRHRMLIHPYAQLVGVVDTFVALSTDRPHRNARGLYEGAIALLQGASEGKFEPAVVRAFLDCMSLFPIASYVRLSDGRFAKVLRANQGMHTKPIVLVLNPDGSETDCELDLSKVDEPQIAEALRSESDAMLRFHVREEDGRG